MQYLEHQSYKQFKDYVRWPNILKIQRKRTGYSQFFINILHKYTMRPKFSVYTHFCTFHIIFYVSIMVAVVNAGGS